MKAISQLFNSLFTSVKTTELIRFYRRGYFITENFTDTQCTVKGWEAYRYKLTVEAGNKLDESGFLIDHNELHRCISKWAETEDMLSCEQSIQAICYKVGSKCIEYGVDLYKLGFEIAPVNKKDLTYGEDGELTHIDEEAAQSMPAGAEYWCTFK
jgi:hypothetical protein